jgi:hypothetical protein
MDLDSALLETGIAQAMYNGIVAVVKDEMGEFSDKFLLTIQDAAMPPFYSREFDAVEEIEKEVGLLDWKSVEAE